MQTHSGASLDWNVCGPMILPMLNDAEIIERPDTCCLSVYHRENRGTVGKIVSTFIVYPLKLAPVHAKIRAKGATV